MEPSRRVQILVFDDAEVLDVCGPLEVFAVAGARGGTPPPFITSLVAERPGPVTLRHGVRILPDHCFADAPPACLLVIPGGMGTRREMENAALVTWVGRRAREAELVLSVCTGALLLGRAGLLEGQLATTHHGAIELLREVAPTARVVSGPRFMDNGHLVLSAGISAGIDAALHVVERLEGGALAEETAAWMEYHWDHGEEVLADEGL